MPELPEVEAARCLLAEHCAGQRIAGCVAVEAGGGARDGLFDDLVLRGASGEGNLTAQGFEAALVARTVTAVHRHGKHLWLELAGPGPHLLVHLGMTGAVVVEGVAATAYKSSAKRGIGSSSVAAAAVQFPPRFTKLQLSFAGGARVALVDPRRLARVALRPAPVEASPPLSALAPDALLALPPPGAFAAALHHLGAPIKAALLDQGRVVSGVGNWVADEALYQARVHPAAPCRTLDEAQLAALHAALAHVLRTAVAANADSAAFPPGWLFHARWCKGKKGQVPRDAEGQAITFEDVGGRTSAVVLSRQRKGQRREVPLPASVTGVDGALGFETGGAFKVSATAPQSRPRKRKAENLDVKTGEAQADIAAAVASTASRSKRTPTGGKLRLSRLT